MGKPHSCRTELMSDLQTVALDCITIKEDYFWLGARGEWLCELPQVWRATQSVWYCLAKSQILLSLGFYKCLFFVRYPGNCGVYL